MLGTSDTAREDSARALTRAIVKDSGTSFFWAMRLIPKEKRQALFAIYAFCRVIDDLVDQPGDPSQKRRRLGDWRGEIEALFQGRARHPLTVALAPSVARFGLKKEDLLAFIKGMETDAQPPVRIKDRAQLNLYCERVACAVGRLSNAALGVDPELGDRLARHLGLALQLTNILRDLVEDAQLDRCYLPADMLAEASIIDTEPEQILAHPNLATVCQALADEALEQFEAADVMLSKCDPKTVRTALIMRHVYGRILQRLVARGWTKLSPRLSLGKAERLWIGLRYGFGS